MDRPRSHRYSYTPSPLNLSAPTSVDNLNPEEDTRNYAPVITSAAGLHRSMIMAHRSQYPPVADRSSIDVDDWRQGVSESVAFSPAGSVFGDRPESITSSRVTVGNMDMGRRGRPMAIPLEAEPEVSNTGTSSLRKSNGVFAKDRSQ